MKHFQASVVERRIINQPSRDFFSEPMETGWAAEAIFFLWIEEMGNGRFPVKVQISADGINWVDEGTTTLVPGPGHYFLKVRHFGNWLRIKAELSGMKNEMKLTVQLHLKE